MFLIILKKIHLNKKMVFLSIPKCHNNLQGLKKTGEAGFIQHHFLFIDNDSKIIVIL